MRTCAVNVAASGEYPSMCGEPVAGAIHWKGEGYTDEACDRHLALFAGVTSHTVERYPTCDVEVLDPYSRVDLIACGELAVTVIGSAHVCGWHLAILAEAN